jgi:hypothetical protein
MTMTMTFPLAFANASRRLSSLRYRLSERTKRYGCAWRYATHRTKRDDGLRLIYEGEQAAGYYSLECLSLDTVCERAAEKWGEVPGMREWAVDAAARVARKWESGGDAVYAAEDWALDLVKEYARDDGIELVEIEP